MAKYFFLIAIIVAWALTKETFVIWLGSATGACLVWDIMVLPLWRRRQRKKQTNDIMQAMNKNGGKQ